MAEAPAPTQETPPSPERSSSHEATVGLRARLLIGSDARNPDHQLTGIKKEDFTPDSERNYGIYERASGTDRRSYWQGKEDNDFVKQKDAWTASTIQSFEKGKGFFQSEKGANWNELCQKLGIDAVGFDATQADALYDKYFTGDKKVSQVRQFVEEVRNAYKTQEGTTDLTKLQKDLPAIQWLANIFGKDHAAEIITNLIHADAENAIQPDVLVAQATAQEKVNDKEVTRVNNLRDREKELLSFLWEHTEEQPQLMPQEEPPTTTEKIPPYEGPLSVENVLAGKGFEEIEKHGWDEYRKALTTVSFSQMIERQMQDIERLQQEAAQNPQTLTEEELITQNKAALERVNKLRQQLLQDYSNDKGFSFYTHESHNKFNIQGKNVNFDAWPLRRIYVTTYTRTAPETYTSLFEALREENALDSLTLTLNRESYHTGSEKNNFYDNTIIIYVHGEQPEVMQKIAVAMQKAKENAQQSWRMHPEDLAEAKMGLLSKFKIPLDDASGFVEASDNASYDHGEEKDMGRELYINYQYPLAWGPKITTFEGIRQGLKPYTPDNPGRFESKGLAMRRKYMPGLLFEEQQVATPETQHPDWEKLRNYFRFDKEGMWKNAADIRAAFKASDVSKRSLPVYYPGAGFDISYPLAFTDASTFVFTDYVYINEDGTLRMNHLPDQEIEDIGGKITSRTTEGTLGQGGKLIVTFEWGGKERKVIMYAEDATKFVPPELSNGSAFTILKAPTPFGRGTEDLPGYLFEPDALTTVLKQVAKGGFYHLHPTKELPSDILGFKRIIEEPPSSPKARSMYKSGFPLYQKTADDPDVRELIQLDYNLILTDAARDGLEVLSITDQTLPRFEARLKEIRETYNNATSDKQKAMLPILRRLFIDFQLTDERKKNLRQYGRGFGLTDEQKMHEYLEQSKQIALQVFPELANLGG